MSSSPGKFLEVDIEDNLGADEDTLEERTDTDGDGPAFKDELGDMIVSADPGRQYTIGELLRWKDDPDELARHAGADEQLQELNDMGRRVAEVSPKQTAFDFAKSFRMQSMAARLGPELTKSFRMQSMAAIPGPEFGKWSATLRESLRRSRLPSNLRSLPVVTADEVLDFTLEHGVSLYLVPRTPVANRLLRAKDAASVRRILGEQRREIVADCRAVLEACDQPSTLGLRQMALQSAAALEGDLYAPAQALAGNLLDCLMKTHLNPALARAAKRKPGETHQDVKDRLEELEAWQEYVACALWSTFQHYFQDEGDDVPHAFSRHATAHAVGRRQYSRRSAVQGLMAVSSALGYINGLS